MFSSCVICSGSSSYNIYPRNSNIYEYVLLFLVLNICNLYFIISINYTLANADWEPEVIGDSCNRIWYPDLVQEGQWHHIVLVLNRAVLKNSSFSLYMDGQHVHTQKVISINNIYNS